jgi:hypothetical protein
LEDAEPKSERTPHNGSRCRNEIEKLDNVTWYGHCVIHVIAALNDLPVEAKLDFCQDLSRFIRHQQREVVANLNK